MPDEDHGLGRRRRAIVAAGHALRTSRGRAPRRGRFVVIVVASTCLLALGLYAAGVAFATFSSEYGFDPSGDAAGWRSLRPAYSEVSRCARCHETQQARLASATHAGIGCESCHGPLAEHALARAGTPETDLAVSPPDDTVCVGCHASAIGRPASLRVIKPGEHYVSTCLACHDPHSGISQRPPVVEHTLERLPDCVVCHGPGGFKVRNQRHPLVPTADSECLACHLPGRGPAQAAVEDDT